MKKIILSLYFLFFLFSFSYAQTSEITKLQALLKTTKDSIQYIDVLNKMATLLYNTNVDSTFYLANKAKTMAATQHYEKGKADALNNLGIFYLLNGNSNFALRYYKKAYTIYKELKDSANCVASTLNMGTVYIGDGKKKRAMEKLDAALLLGGKLQKDSILARVITIYLYCYPDKFNERQKKEYLTKAKKIALKYKIRSYLLVINQINSRDLLKQNKTEQKGLTLLSKTIDTALNAKLYYLSMNMVMLMGDHFYKTDPSLAAFYYKKALTIADKNNFANWKRVIVLKLFDFYTKRNDIAKAATYSQMAISLYKEKELKDNLSQIDYLDYVLKEEQVASLVERSIHQIILLILVAIICVLAVTILMVIRKNLNRTRKLNQQVVNQNNQMKETLEALEQSQKENNNLLKIVAHDLRSPLAGIYSLSSMMQETSHSDSDQEMLRLIKDSSSDSLQLVNNLLQIQFKTETLNKVPIDLMDLLSHCVSLLQRNAKEKSQQINLHADQVTISANREKLWRVISNLITNAIKFSPNNTTIEVKTEEIRDHIRISVTDEGIGIPVDIEDQIFNMFTEFGRQGTSGEESFGLGLAISKQIVNAHDGKIWFERRAERGTAFFIELPYSN